MVFKKIKEKLKLLKGKKQSRKDKIKNFEKKVKKDIIKGEMYKGALVKALLDIYKISINIRKHAHNERLNDINKLILKLYETLGIHSDKIKETSLIDALKNLKTKKYESLIEDINDLFNISFKLSHKNILFKELYKLINDLYANAISYYFHLKYLKMNKNPNAMKEVYSFFKKLSIFEDKHLLINFLAKLKANYDMEVIGYNEYDKNRLYATLVAENAFLFYHIDEEVSKDEH